MNRKLIWSIPALVALAVGGCHTNKDNDGQYHIYGVANELFEGKKIFLVPWWDRLLPTGWTRS